MPLDPYNDTFHHTADKLTAGARAIIEAERREHEAKTARLKKRLALRRKQLSRGPPRSRVTGPAAGPSRNIVPNWHQVSNAR